MNAPTIEADLCENLLGCCQFSSTMLDMVRTQFGQELESSLDAATYANLDRALASVLARVDAGIYSAWLARAAGSAAR